MSKKSQYQIGLTLVELIVVIVLLGIISAYTTIRFMQPSLAEYFTAVEQLKRDILLTQSLSMGLNAQYRIIFSGNYYYITDPAGTRYNHSVFGTSNISLASSASITTNLSSNTLIFDGLGRPYSLSGKLSSNGIITVSTTGNSQIVNVTPETGYIYQ
jgi:prepilin-type N-terminal cleavage/methylation domain-containing protein